LLFKENLNIYGDEPLVQQMAFDPGSRRSCGASFADMADQQLFYNIPTSLSFFRESCCDLFPLRGVHISLGADGRPTYAHTQLQISTKMPTGLFAW